MAQVFVHADAAKAFTQAPVHAKRAIARWKTRLEQNPTAGQQIPAKQIPRELAKKFTLDALWRLELSHGWRALYTIAIKENQKRRVVLLFIGTHKQYEKLMGYTIR